MSATGDKQVALEFLLDDAVKDSLRQDVLEMEAMTTAILENARIRHGQGNLDLETVDLAQVVRECSANSMAGRLGYELSSCHRWSSAASTPI